MARMMRSKPICFTFDILRSKLKLNLQFEKVRKKLGGNQTIKGLNKDLCKKDKIKILYKKDKNKDVFKRLSFIHNKAILNIYF